MVVTFNSKYKQYIFLGKSMHIHFVTHAVFEMHTEELWMIYCNNIILC